MEGVDVGAKAGTDPDTEPEERCGTAVKPDVGATPVPENVGDGLKSPLTRDVGAENGAGGGLSSMGGKGGVAGFGSSIPTNEPNVACNDANDSCELGL